MSNDVVGSPIKLVLGGFTFRVAADADPKHGKPAWKNEPEHTTSGSLRKMTAQDQTVESFTIKVNDDELAQLKKLAESPENITMAYVLPSGATYRTRGFFDYDGRQAASGKVDVKLTPTDPEGWTLF